MPAPAAGHGAALLKDTPSPRIGEHLPPAPPTASKVHPNGLVAGQIRAIQQTPHRATAKLPPSNPHRPSSPHRRA